MNAQPSHPPHFADSTEVAARLAETGYLADDDISTIVFLADRLSKPLLIEGPAGVGKTELAKALATLLKVELVRLQCYEGVDETKALYEWNYKKQLLRIQAGGDSWDEVSDDIFGEPFLLERPVLRALRTDDPVVLLIDEVDKLDYEAEALLLEILSDWQITIPEMGTVRTARPPYVVLTSNNSRELSEALKRRCLYLFLDYPSAEREKAIVLQRVPAISEALRVAGVPVSVGENLDALQSLEHIDWLDRAAWRSALAATMVKSDAHRPAFDTLFELYFGLGGNADDAPPSRAAELEEFTTELAEALGRGDGGALQDLAQRAVDQFGRVEDSPSGNLFFEYPIWRALDIGSLARPPDDDTVDSRVARDEFERRLAEWRRRVQAEVRRRVARRRGAEAVARYSVRPLPQDLVINTAMADELHQLRRSVQPLARKLATRLALKHRRSRHGRLDMRRTVRRSLSTGGVPFDLVERKRASHRPELFVLCDVSDSVARFARFSLMLVHALAWQFTKVRSFVFLETIDEVTHLFEHEDFMDAVARINAEANVVHIDSHSNYGGSFEDFVARYGAAVNSRSTVLILGDARNNYRSSKAEALKEIDSAAHRTYWLNPESIAYWDSGDSLASVYAACIDDMAEVRTLRQLERFIALRL